MIYFIILIISLIIFFGISQFIKFPSIKEPIFHFFIQQLSIITLSISLFAIAITGGKTILLLFIPAYLFLILKKKMIFIAPLKKELNQNILFTLLIIPIILIQFLLNFDLSTLTPYLPSDDILFYSGLSNSIIQFGNENRYEALNSLYPHLFSGISPYHFYEIWFTSLIGFISGYGYTFILQFVVYPYLVWLFVLGILSAIEHLVKQLQLKHYILTFLLLLIGPIYFSVYEVLFHDGEFFPTTVFTISGFVKQTLPFSYYGQKHLPVYIFSILSFLFLIKEKYKSSLVTGLFIAVCSFGPILGVFGAFGLLLLFQKNFKTKENFILLSIFSITLFSFIVILKMGINNEISEKTIYFSNFLKYLNFKGEILRIAAKIVGPIIWFSILYFPLILLIFIFRKRIFNNPELKILYMFLLFSFGIGSFAISLVQGMNSDQFLTNLIPIFNVIIIITLIYLFQSESVKKIVQFCIFTFALINGCFLVSFHLNNHKNIDKSYSKEIYSKVKNLLNQEKSNPIIAFVLPDSFIQNFAPLIWYTQKPGKIFLLENYFNLVNINYPYIKYERNSTSIAFSADNQMRFFLKEKIVPFENFGSFQKDFLKQKSIKWLFCAKGVQLSEQVESLIEKKYVDTISGEVYCRLNTN